LSVATFQYILQSTSISQARHMIKKPVTKPPSTFNLLLQNWSFFINFYTRNNRVLHPICQRIAETFFFALSHFQACSKALSKISLGWRLFMSKNNLIPANPHCSYNRKPRHPPPLPIQSTNTYRITKLMKLTSYICIQNCQNPYPFETEFPHLRKVILNM